MPVEGFKVTSNDPGQKVNRGEHHDHPHDHGHRYTELPTQKATPETKVNWLGSSYSGADVRVVAHLYGGGVEGYSRISRIRERLQVSQDILKGLQHANNWARVMGVNGTVSKSRHFIAHHIIKEPLSVEAVDVVVGIFLVAQTRSDLFRGIDASLLEETKRHDQLHEQLKTFKEITKSGIQTFELSDLQTLSIQSHREKAPVRALGISHVKGHVWGPRTFAGTMIFTTFAEHPLRKLISAMHDSHLYDTRADQNLRSLVSDQIPPIDLTIIFANEYGNFSRMGIYGVEFFSDAITFSSEDLFSENVVNYMARDVDIMTEVGRVKLSRSERSSSRPQFKDAVTASDLLVLNRKKYNQYVEGLGLRRELRGI